MKKIIHLTENDIRNIVYEAYQRILLNVSESTASGVAGSGLPGEYTAPVFGDDETFDRTPGDTCGMHDRVGNSNL